MKQVFIFLMSILSMTMNGQTYSSLWKQAEEAEKKDLPRTQYDVLMKGQEILSVVGEANENGLALSTNLVPSYKLTIQAATIQQLVEKRKQWHLFPE